MRVLKKVRHYITPTKENAYRPHLLSRSWLGLFLALSLVVEGFLVSSLVARQSDTFITSAPTQTNVAAVASAGSLNSFLQSLVRQSSRVFSNEDNANAILGSIGTLLVVVIVLTFLLHIDVQARDMLLGGSVVAAIAFMFIAANVHFLPRTPQTASAAEVALRSSPVIQNPSANELFIAGTTLQTP